MLCLTEYLAFFLEWPVQSGIYCIILSYVIQPFKNEKVMFYLTLILLTWRIWWAPNNAGKWQMGFNSAFKGLKVKSYLTVNTIWLGYKKQ